MRKIIVGTLLVFLVFFIAGSCVSPIQMDEVSDVSVNKAFLFGRFGKAYASVKNESVYLICQSKDGIREHVFVFGEKDSLVVKEVVPGEYQIVGYRVVSGNKLNDVGFFYDQNQRLMDLFTVNAGEAVYLGDYILQAPVQDIKSASPGSIRMLIQDKIQAARYQLRKEYAGFENILTRDLLQ